MSYFHNDNGQATNFFSQKNVFLDIVIYIVAFFFSQKNIADQLLKEDYYDPSFNCCISQWFIKTMKMIFLTKEFTFLEPNLHL